MTSTWHPDPGQAEDDCKQQPHCHAPLQPRSPSTDAGPQHDELLPRCSWPQQLLPSGWDGRQPGTNSKGIPASSNCHSSAEKARSWRHCRRLAWRSHRWSAWSSLLMRETVRYEEREGEGEQMWILTLMIVILTAKVSVLRESTGESMLRRTRHQLVAAHLRVMMRRCRSSCRTVRAGRMCRRCVWMMVWTLAHATCSTGRGAGGGTVASHGAQWPKAKWCRCTAGGNADTPQTGSAAVHGRQTRSGATRVLAQSSSAIGEPHLNARLGQAGRLGQLLPRVHIRVLRTCKGALQRLQLLRGEGGAWSSLLAFQWNSWLRFGVANVRVTACKYKMWWGDNSGFIKRLPTIRNAPQEVVKLSTPRGQNWSKSFSMGATRVAADRVTPLTDVGNC